MTLPTLRTVAWTAEYLGVMPATVRQLMASGEIRARKVGKGWVTTDDALRAFLEQTTTPSPATPRVSGRATRRTAAA